MPPTPPITLVPVRDPGVGKNRLAATLSAEQRAALTSAMLADVVTALHRGGVRRVVALASGPLAAAAARTLGVDVLLDPPGRPGLNEALRVAAGRIRATSSLVVPADLPLLQAEEVARLIAMPGEVLVAPTHDSGTGGLLRRPAWAIDTSYGPRSSVRHLVSARKAGYEAERIDMPGFRADVDDLEDLLAVAASPHLGLVTRRVIDQLDGLADGAATPEASPVGR